MVQIIDSQSKDYRFEHLLTNVQKSVIHTLKGMTYDKQKRYDSRAENL